ncbi:hypothetical protein SALBM135S_05067 [Streptomyces alboniger]
MTITTTPQPLPDGLAQDAMDAEVAKAQAAAVPGAHHPPRDYPPYRSSHFRNPKRPPVPLRDPEAVELSGPAFGVTDVTDLDRDLTRQHSGEPLSSGSPSAGGSSTAQGRPIAASSSNSGRPTPPGGTPTSSTSIRRRSTRTSRASAGA